MKKSSLILCVLLSFGVVSVVFHLPHSALGAYPRLIESFQSATPPGYSQELITVKFVQGSKVCLREGKLVTLDGNKLKSFYEVLAHYPGLQVERLFSRSEQKLHEERKEGEIRSGKELPDLNLYYRLRVPSGTNIMALINDLNNLEIVEIAYPAALPAPPPQTPDFTNQQGYLNAAPGGIDANFAWTVPGGDGIGVKVIDIEYSWNTSHEDLGKGVGAIIGDPPVDPFNDDNHGTAVLGELIADDNEFGVSGIAHGASLGLVAANTAGGYNVANAVSIAVANTNPGDVILIEQQIAGPNYTGVGQFGLVPVEWVQEVYDAIFVATATGRVIVEAAGNGSQNLDDPVYGGRFDRNVRDSGAIIVGAGGSPLGGNDLARLSFSNYGSRLDLQGWGENVVTTGYGDLYTGASKNEWYTSNFSGTSSASPIVAGAATVLQAVVKARTGTPLSPESLRQLLVSTGTPQVGTQHIGPRPDLRAAIGATTDIVPPTVTLLNYPDSVVTGNLPKVDVTFSWQGSDNVTPPGSLVYQYKLEGHPDYANWSSWSSGTSKIYSLPLGNYTFKVRGKDEAGNYPGEGDPATAQYAFTVSLRIIVYPKPCYPDQGQVVTIANLTTAEVYIYDLGGNLIRTLGEAEAITEGGSKTVTWDCKNGNGEPVAAGTYVYYTPGATGKKTGTMFIIR